MDSGVYREFRVDPGIADEQDFLGPDRKSLHDPQHHVRQRFRPSHVGRGHDGIEVTQQAKMFQHAARGNRAVGGQGDGITAAASFEDLVDARFD